MLGISAALAAIAGAIYASIRLFTWWQVKRNATRRVELEIEKRVLESANKVLDEKASIFGARRLPRLRVREGSPGISRGDPDAGGKPTS